MNTLNKRDDNNKLAPREGNHPVERMERRPSVAPPVDIHESVDEILVVADVPGARSDSVTVKVEKNELYLHARRDERAEGRALLGGEAAPDYARTFLVPRGIDADRIGAEMSNGVLRIHLPKSESLKPRKIQVKAG